MAVGMLFPSSMASSRPFQFIICGLYSLHKDKLFDLALRKTFVLDWLRFDFKSKHFRDFCCFSWELGTKFRPYAENELDLIFLTQFESRDLADITTIGREHIMHVVAYAELCFLRKWHQRPTHGLKSWYGGRRRPVNGSNCPWRFQLKVLKVWTRYLFSFTSYKQKSDSDFYHPSEIHEFWKIEAKLWNSGRPKQNLDL